MSDSTKIMIVEDHRLYREGLKAMLSQDMVCDVVAEATDGLDALKKIQKVAPDLVLLDLSMPRMNGFSVIREIKRMMPEVKILVLSVHDAQEYILEALKAGADGYSLKDSSRKELKIAINSVLTGRCYVNPNVTGEIIQNHITGSQQKKLRPKDLSHREMEVLKMLGEGYQNKEISSMLNISVKTVEKHRANIMGKLDLHNRASLTNYACKIGLVTLKGSQSSAGLKEEARDS